MFKFSTKKLVRAGVIAALYTAVTYAFAPYAYGPLQIRPAEALCILPLFFIEAVPGLFVGCALANLFSGYGVYDVVFGSLITLLAAGLTFIVGRLLKENFLSVIIGGLFPVLFNAFGIPLIIVLVSLGEEAALYWTYFADFLLTQSIWIYALGIPLYFAVIRIRKKVAFLQSDEYAETIKEKTENENGESNPK